MARTNNNSVTLIAGIYSRQRITMELENNNNILQIYTPQMQPEYYSRCLHVSFWKGSQNCKFISFAIALSPLRDW